MNTDIIKIIRIIHSYTVLSLDGTHCAYYKTKFCNERFY